MKGRKAIEDKWIKQWKEEGVYKTPDISDGDDKEYVLVMFPYPSGAGLHAGHARVYTGTDVLARFFRMNGKKVLHPMGWDAFGLPAENAAIKQKRNPKDISKENIVNFKRQMDMLGLSYDWDREIDTSDPEYYAITQHLFIEFFKRGLLHKKDTSVYYCPFCKTGLAEEEVMGDGTHERCGNEVEKRKLSQWVFRITTYAESLLESLKDLDWPRGILEMQKNWIGRKEGINITYDVDGQDEKITCFTTRPDTNFGATFVVLAPEHEFAEKIMQGKLEADENVKTYIKASLKKTERERKKEGKKKTGIFTGYYVINKLNDKKLPIWISDFVLKDVGTGAVVGVPGHDTRDFEFAQAMDIPVERVVVGSDGDSSEITSVEQVQEEEGTMVNSDFLNDMPIKDAIGAMMDHLEKEDMGERVISYHLRDWIFSRQRYWGEPIPMIFCETCAKKGEGYLALNKAPEDRFAKLVEDVKDSMTGWYPLEKNDLPLELPHVESYEPLETGKSPLAAVEGWTDVQCPHCGSEATRETDTMPNWAGSCWYFLQFAISQENRGLDGWNEALEKEVKSWHPVDWYIGGAEHAVLHLLYARFWMHALNDMGMINFREPFTRLRNVGMLIAEDGQKMSKSRGNVLNPDDVVSEYGADVLRSYEMFMAPFNQEIAWSTKTLRGVKRFLDRIWRIYHDTAKVTKEGKTEDRKLASELQTTIQKITSDLTNVKFNTPIAACMEFLNAWERSDSGLSEKDARKYLQLIAPFAPFISDEIWREVFDEKTSIHVSKWPVADESLIQDSKIVMPIQVNGKVREKIEISADTSEDDVKQMAVSSAKIQKWINGKEYSIIYIPGRILNIVVK